MYEKCCGGVSFVFVLEDSGWNGGLHLVGCFQHLREKQDALLLYRGSLLVAERGRAVQPILKYKFMVKHLCVL